MLVLFYSLLSLVCFISSRKKKNPCLVKSGCVSVRTYSELPPFLKNGGSWDLLKMGAPHTPQVARELVSFSGLSKLLWEAGQNSPGDQ